MVEKSETEEELITFRSGFSLPSRPTVDGSGPPKASDPDRAATAARNLCAGKVFRRRRQALRPRIGRKKAMILGRPTPFPVLLVLACATLSGASSGGELPSAWRTLVERDPAVADDPSVEWRERLILHLLTPRQAEDYYSGRASAEELILADGRTLAAALDESSDRAGGVYVPLAVSCRLFEAFAAEPPVDGEYAERGFRLGRFDLSAQGGSSAGCPIPEDALAVVLRIRARGIGPSQPRVKLWADGMPEPATAALEPAARWEVEDRTATTVVNLCAGPACGPAGLRLKSSRAAVVEADLIGYFRPLSAADGVAAGPTPIFPLAVEGPSNNFFGTGAGAGNTGVGNSFFGGSAGTVNSSGSNNSFFGREAGRSNTTAGGNSFFGGRAGFFNSTGASNSFFGFRAGENNISAFHNSFFGALAGYSNTTGFDNSFFGSEAGFFNVTGRWNSFFGRSAGVSNTTGDNNSFFGSEAGFFNTTGGSNSFFGRYAGNSNTTGNFNSFFGAFAGESNTSGFENSFFGDAAGISNTTGARNAFFGRSAGVSNTTGESNSFFGYRTGGSTTTANSNSFFGRSAGEDNTTGESNSFFGRGSGRVNSAGSANAFFGGFAGFANTTGSNNSYFGALAGLSNTTEHNNSFFGFFSNGAAGITNATAVGFRAQVMQSNSLVLGSIAGLNDAPAGVNVGIGTPTPQRQLHLNGSNAVFRMDRDSDTAAFLLVRTNSAGTPLKTFVVGANASGANNGEFIVNDLGTAVGGAGARRMTITNAGEAHFTGTVRAPAFVQTSSLRHKSDVATVTDAVDLVGRLRGVRFLWNETGKPSLGLIAEEAAEIVPELVEMDERSGRAEALNYAALTAVLIEAVKEQRGQIQDQQKQIEAQREEIQTLRTRLSRLESLEAGFARERSP
jgi:hypothetical protein